VSQKIIEKDGLKIRQLTELRTNTAKEHMDAMLKRVEYFKQKNLEKSQFNSFIQNTVVKGLSTLLSLKTNIDKAIGEKNLEKFHDIIENILLFGL